MCILGSTRGIRQEGATERSFLQHRLSVVFMVLGFGKALGTLMVDWAWDSANLSTVYEPYEVLLVSGQEHNTSIFSHISSLIIPWLAKR